MLFTDCSLSKRRQTCVSYEQQQRNFTNKQAVPKIQEKGWWQSSVLKFWQVKLCLFDFFEFIAETSEKVFVYKCKLSLSLALLYSVDLFINKRKTKVYKGTRPNIGIGSCRCRSIGCRFFPIPFSIGTDWNGIGTVQNSSSGQLTEVIKSWLISVSVCQRVEIVGHATLLTKIISGNVYVNKSKAWMIEFSMYKQAG